MTEVLTKIRRGLNITIDTLVIALLTVLIAVVCIQVFSRYVLNDPKTWTEELARYLFVWIVFLASSIVFREKHHLTIDVVVSLFPDKVQKVLSIMVQVLISAFIITILYHSQRLIMITSYQTSPTLSLPMSYVYLAFPAALGLMLIEQLFSLVVKDPPESKPQ